MDKGGATEMISIEEHGGIFGGSGFQFRGEYSEVTLKDDVKYGDLVRVGTEFRDLPLFEGMDSPMMSTHFSPGGKYAFVIHGTSRRSSLYEREYVDGNVEYRKLPNPVGFPSRVYTVNTVVWNNRENLFIIMNDAREYGTFQLINDVWTKIDMSFEGKDRMSDGKFSPDDEYLILKTSVGTTQSRNLTIVKVSGSDSRASFAFHFHTTTSVFRFDNFQRPYFLTDRIFTTINSTTQHIVTITPSAATMATGVPLVATATFYAFLDGGEYLMTGNSSYVYKLYRRNTTNVYTEIVDGYNGISPRDITAPSSLFESGDLDQCVLYGGINGGIKFRVDKSNDKVVRVMGFNPANRDGIIFPNNVLVTPPNTVDRIFTLGNSSNDRKLAREFIIGYKFSQDDEFSQEYIGIAKKGGKAGDKITVVKVTG